MGSIGAGLKRLFGLGRLSDEFYEGLEDALTEADVGAALSARIVSSLREACRKKGINDEAGVRAELEAGLAGMAKGLELGLPADRLAIFLLLGVNGVGKTTSLAKLGAYYARCLPKDKIILAACDTFRAGAVDQLIIHGERLGLRVVANRNSGDPGAVLFDAIQAAKASEARLVLADTAGRLHNKANLMRELEKIDKIARTQAGQADYRKLLVIDATTGQNGLQQAEIFAETVGLDAGILAKYDSSARGGMALAISQRLGLPTAFVGTGEGYGDLEPFSPAAYAKELLG